MTEIDPYGADPARLRIVQLQDAARERHEDYEPTAEELRLVLVEAFPLTAGLKVWAGQLGCTPAFLQDVLDGREPPAGDMLDILGMEPIPGAGVYADPLLDREARAIQQRRWSTAPTAATYRKRPKPQPLQRIARAPRPGAAPLDLFAVGVAAPKPREEK